MADIENKTPKKLKPIVQSLWIGDKLSIVEQLCISSFIKTGHRFHLYVYNKEHIKGVPPGTELRNGNDIMPYSNVWNDYVQGFADIFRYCLLYKKGGFWVDMDVIALQNFEQFQAPYVFGMQSTSARQKFANGVIKAPKNSLFMKRLYNVCMSKGRNVEFGETGPVLLTQMLRRDKKLLDFARLQNVFYPVPFEERQEIFNPNSPYATLANNPGSSFAIHLWNHKLFVDKDCMENCLFDLLIKKYMDGKYELEEKDNGPSGKCENYQHFVIIRFTVRFNFGCNKTDLDYLFGEERMEKRFEFFENITARSLVSQTDQNFTTIILYDQYLQDKYKIRLGKICRKHGFVLHLWNHDDTFGSTKWMLPYIDQDKELILYTRLDDDDGFHKDYIKLIHDKYCRLEYCGRYVYPMKGRLVLLYEDSVLTMNERVHYPQGITLLCRPECQYNVYKFDFMKIPEDLRMYVENFMIWFTNHAFNDSKRFKRLAKHKTAQKIAAKYGYAISTLEKEYQDFGWKLGDM